MTAPIDPALQAHLTGGLTTLCHAWAIIRRDGTVLGFTDHDLDLTFDGITFHAGSGLAARAFQQSTGLAVDNTEALGMLNDASISEDDITASRYDAAQVCCWRLNWADPAQRMILFRGTIGEMRRTGVAFTAELRGLTEALNRPMGRIYQKACTAVLGDATCRVDLTTPENHAKLRLVRVTDGRVLHLAGAAPHPPAWFRRGHLLVLDGAAHGLGAAIKSDRIEDGLRIITLWEPLRAHIAAGDHVTLTAGCDKRVATCRDTFANLLNYQGFPDLPDEGWIFNGPAQAAQTAALDGGSRR